MSTLKADGFFTMEGGVPHTPSSVHALTSAQSEVIESVLSGTNTLMHGPAGTGKSVAIKALVVSLATRNIAFALTAPTGAAAVNVGGSTIHSSLFRGLGLMRGNSTTLWTKLRKQSETLRRLRALQVLIIDEISMVSAAFMDTMNQLIQKARSNTEPFGGLTVLLCGDFFQLPPVVEGGDRGHQPVFAFESQVWDQLLLKTVHMSQVYRQQDDQFVQLLHRMRRAALSSEDMGLLRSMVGTVAANHEANVSAGVVPTSLFARNSEAEVTNSSKLEQLLGELHRFEANVSLVNKPSSSEDDIKELFRVSVEVSKNAPVPQTLGLKVGAQVMLRANLNVEGGLANGSRGSVIAFSRDGFPVVRFASGATRTIGPFDFEFQYPTGTVVVTQLPLILAWALTIHKCQGATLDAARISTKHMFAPGHAYVAFSRLRSLKGLYLDDFAPGCVYTDSRVSTKFENLAEAVGERAHKRQKV